MLIGICSAKGSPGTTSAALALGAVWPRPVVVVEADPSGGDLAYRCQAATGGPLHAAPNLLTLAAASRGRADSSMLEANAQQLKCGVPVVQGVTAPTQSRGLIGIWGELAAAMESQERDVLVDLGRLDRSNPAFPVAEAADVLLWVGATSLESVMHLRAGLGEAITHVNSSKVTAILPLLVGEDAHAGRDCADLDQLLAKDGLPVLPALHLAYDPRALDRLQNGEQPGGRLGRTLLVRSARTVAAAVLAHAGQTAYSEGVR